MREKKPINYPLDMSANRKTLIIIRPSASIRLPTMLPLSASDMECLGSKVRVRLYPVAWIPPTIC